MTERLALASLSARTARVIIFALICQVHSGCAPLRTGTQSANPAEGVIYFLPKKQIKVTYTRKPGESESCTESISLATTPTMPDTAAGGFVATIPVNQVGTNKSHVQVNSRGLLQSAKAETTSHLADIIGEAIAAPVALPMVDSENVAVCAPISITQLVDVPLVATSACAPDTICVRKTGERHQVYVVNSPAGIAAEIASPTGLVDTEVDYSETLEKNDVGLFYRVELPYTVTMLVDVDVTSDQSQPKPTPVLWLPNESPVGFAPFRKSFFGNKTTTLTFSDGSLTKYDADYSGDVLSIVKLPITVIGAVSAAIGEVARARQENAQAEIDLMDKTLALEMARIRYERCSVALAADDQKRIDEYCND